MKLKDLVARKSKVEGSCRVWNGGLTTRGRPYVTQTVDGTLKTVDLHLYLARKVHGVKDNERVTIKTTCGNPRCINPKHLLVQKPNSGVAKGSRKTGAKYADVELNMQVFKSLVTLTKTDTKGILGLHNSTFDRIVSNKAMLPYFQLCIEWHTGVSVEELRARRVSQQKLKVEYRLSPTAIKYVLSDHNYYIEHEDLYLDLLKKCAVLGDHLVWVGDLRQNKPIFKTYAGFTKDATKQMYFAANGLRSDGLTCTCGQANCINPEHIMEA